MGEFLFLLLLHAVPSGSAQIAAQDPAVDTEKPLKFDILTKQAEPDCSDQTANEIVVCAAKTDQVRYRLRRNTGGDFDAEESNKAEFSISENTKIAAENEAAQIGPGVQSNRLMARIKFKF
jgi:hypothetical protein